jgi:hypothetical protein
MLDKSASTLLTQLLHGFFVLAGSIRDWPGFHLEPAKQDPTILFGLAQFLTTRDHWVSYPMLLHGFFVLAGSIRDWPGFHLEPAKQDPTILFGLAQFLTTLGLLVVVFNVADFRYRFRLSVRKYDVRRLGIIVTGTIALVLLLTEFWFSNAFYLPHFLNNENNIKLLLAFMFLLFVIYVVTVCFISPVRFGKSNATRFSEATKGYVYEGNPDTLEIIADELEPTIKDIFRIAQAEKEEIDKPQSLSSSPPSFRAIAGSRLLLALADRRFCTLVVDRAPSFAISCFELAAEYPKAPFWRLLRNLGEAFVLNTSSAFYREESEQAGSVARIVFGNNNLFTTDVYDGSSPLDLPFAKTSELNAAQAEGFSKASCAFFDSYLAVTKATSDSLEAFAVIEPGSAMDQLFKSCKNLVTGLGVIDGYTGDYWMTPEVKRLKALLSFITSASESLAREKMQSITKKPIGPPFRDIFDVLAKLIWETILASTSVSTPLRVSRSIQGTVWNEIFIYPYNDALKIIAFKVRRLLFSEITRLSHDQNVSGALALGFCLNVMGFGGRPIKSHERYDYPIRRCAINWARNNFARLASSNAEIAKYCLQGAISYDQSTRRLIKSLGEAPGKFPAESLELK